ncbi:hypothetical protein VSWAT3_25789 [Vibrionales bacterium SWAT-3]|nr:hypothetical protein VSWAT3_25789 [Vibrionales bacterium SWAT-3]
MRFGINSQMDLAPGTSFLYTMLAGFPFSFTEDFQAC